MMTSYQGGRTSTTPPDGALFPLLPGAVVGRGAGGNNSLLFPQTAGTVDPYPEDCARRSPLVPENIATRDRPTSPYWGWTSSSSPEQQAEGRAEKFSAATTPVYHDSSRMVSTTPQAEYMQETPNLYRCWPGTTGSISSDEDFEDPARCSIKMDNRQGGRNLVPRRYAGEWNQTRMMYPYTVMRREPENTGDMVRFAETQERSYVESPPPPPALFPVLNDPSAGESRGPPRYMMLPFDHQVTVVDNSRSYDYSCIRPRTSTEQGMMYHQERMMDPPSRCHFGGVPPIEDWSRVHPPHFITMMVPISQQHLHHHQAHTNFPHHDVDDSPMGLMSNNNNNGWYTYPEEPSNGAEQPGMFAVSPSGTENCPSFGEDRTVSQRSESSRNDHQALCSNVSQVGSAKSWVPTVGTEAASGPNTPPSSSSATKDSCRPSLELPPLKKRKRDKAKPKRPLSAYNIFFKEERARMLKEVDRHQTEPKTSPSYWATALSMKKWDLFQDLLDESPSSPTARYETTSDKTKQMRKQFPHGISFQQMAREIAQRWKSIDPVRLAECQDRAEEDKKRYNAEIAVYSQKKQMELEAARMQLELTVPGETRRRYLRQGTREGNE